MTVAVDFYFDVASPYSYLAATQVDAVVSAAGGAVQWKPMRLGGVFRAVGNQPPATLPARARYMLRDLYRWAAAYEEPFRFPSAFPINTLLAMRVLAGVEADGVRDAALALFRAYWAEDQDLTRPEVLVGLLGEAAVQRAEEQAVKDRLRLLTDEAVARGVFGAPSMFVGEELFFGNDRLPLVAAEVRRRARDQAMV